MIGVFELFCMCCLEIFFFEGVLVMIGFFVLIVFLDSYLFFLLVDVSLLVYGIVIFMILVGIVLNSNFYSFEDVVFLIVFSFYVGIGF